MRTIPFVYNEVQRHYLAHRTPRDLILKPRQKGATTVVQSEFSRYCWTRPTSTLTLGKDDENTKELRRISEFFYQELPENFRPRRRYNNATLATYPGCKSRAVIGTAGSVNVGRGGTRTHFHGSEVAFWKDAQAIITGAMQAGNLIWAVLESTANGASGWFFERCMEALDPNKKSIWTLHFYPWFFDEEYQLPLDPGEVLVCTDDELEVIEKYALTPEQIKWRRFKIAEIGTLADFLQEYPEDPVTCFKKSGVGYFGDIDHCFKAPFGATYDPSHRYAAGLDFGQQQDFTVCVVIDVTTKTMVDMVRMNKRPWKEMRLAVRDLCKKWHVSVMRVEKNSVGKPNLEAMYGEFTEAHVQTSLWAFDMNASTKPPLMATLKAALHEGGLMLQDIDILRHEFNAAVSKETATKGWTVESPRDAHGHGDTVVATGLAWYAASAI